MVLFDLEGTRHRFEHVSCVSADSNGGVNLADRYSVSSEYSEKSVRPAKVGAWKEIGEIIGNDPTAKEIIDKSGIRREEKGDFAGSVLSVSICGIKPSEGHQPVQQLVKTNMG